MIRIGSKVVCIGPVPDNELNKLERYNKENQSSLFDYPDGRLIKNNIYVVSGFRSYKDSLGVILTDKRSIWRNTGEETGWDSRMFRELDELKLENELKHYKEQLDKSLISP